MAQTLTQEEINERIAILKRFKALLEEQRKKFNDYLKVLELQGSEIEKADADAIAAHTELENQIVSNLASLQKVIVPMENLYRDKVAMFDAEGLSGIPVLKTDLARLQEKVLKQNKANRELLAVQMAKITATRTNLNNPYRNTRTVYAAQQHTGSMISIEG